MCTWLTTPDLCQSKSSAFFLCISTTIFYLWGAGTVAQQYSCLMMTCHVILVAHTGCGMVHLCNFVRAMVTQEIYKTISKMSGLPCVRLSQQLVVALHRQSKTTHLHFCKCMACCVNGSPGCYSFHAYTTLFAFTALGYVFICWYFCIFPFLSQFRILLCCSPCWPL